MEPQNRGLEDDFPFQRVIFQFHVSFRGSNHFPFLQPTNKAASAVSTSSNAAVGAWFGFRVLSQLNETPKVETETTTEVWEKYAESLGCGPLPVTVTTRIITFSVGDPYEPSHCYWEGATPNESLCFFVNNMRRSNFLFVDWFLRKSYRKEKKIRNNFIQH